MTLMTGGQRRMIFKLKNEKGLDDDTLHSLVYNVTKKNSLKHLTTTDAIKVIENLKGGVNKATYQQQKFIMTLYSDLDFNFEQFKTFMKNKFDINIYEDNFFKDVTKQDASKVIEGMKNLKDRRRKAKKVG